MLVSSKGGAFQKVKEPLDNLYLVCVAKMDAVLRGTTFSEFLNLCCQRRALSAPKTLSLFSRNTSIHNVDVVWFCGELKAFAV